MNRKEFEIQNVIDAISFSDMVGTVVITPHEKSGVSVVCNSGEDKLKYEVRGRTLSLEGILERCEENSFGGSKRHVFGNSNVVINSSISNVTICNGVVVSGINGMGKAPEISLEIKVPKNSIRKLSFSSSNKIDVRDISDEIILKNSGQAEYKIFGIDKIRFDSSGQTNAIIEGCSDLEVDASGQGYYSVGGNLDSVNLDISGMSNVNINGDVETLNCDMSGMCSVNVFGKIKYKQIDKSGMSSFNSK